MTSLPELTERQWLKLLKGIMMGVVLLFVGVPLLIGATSTAEAPSLIGSWGGLEIESDEAPFVGVVQLGVGTLTIGAGGYAMNKRYPFVPIRYRRYTLQVHEWLMLVGTSLVVPHVLFAEDFEGLGLFIAILLTIEVASGFYGRHLHRRVSRFGGDDTPAVINRFVETTNEKLLSRWRRIHITLVLVTALAILVHIYSVVE